MSISIIIPSTGDREEILHETINNAIAALRSIKGEIILIKRREKVVNIIDEKLRIIDVDFNNVSKSRNLGAKLASNELLFFIDDDINISEKNLEYIINFNEKCDCSYLLANSWVHSDKIIELKKSNFLAQMLGMSFPNDSFKQRYESETDGNDWIDHSLFHSGMNAVFWELCFCIRKQNYISIGGMDEFYNFGNEGVSFLKRALEHKISYFVAADNIVIHNEWDKFTNWSVPEKRWIVEAELINNRKGYMKHSYLNYLYKIVYGQLFYLSRKPLAIFLHSQKNAAVKN